MYAIQSLRDGGFVVIDGYRQDCMTQMLFASASIDEALDYIKRQMVRPSPSSDEPTV